MICHWPLLGGYGYIIMANSNEGISIFYIVYIIQSFGPSTEEYVWKNLNTNHLTFTPILFSPSDKIAKAFQCEALFFPELKGTWSTNCFGELHLHYHHQLDSDVVALIASLSQYINTQSKPKQFLLKGAITHQY